MIKKIIKMELSEDEELIEAIKDKNIEKVKSILKCSNKNKKYWNWIKKIKKENISFIGIYLMITLK